MSATLKDLATALRGNDTLRAHGTISEYLPAYGELTYQFNAGLSARIASHGNSNYQMTLGGFYHMEPGTIDQIVNYLTSIDD